MTTMQQQPTNIKAVESLREAVAARFDCAPKYYIRTFGCQQNVSDSERMAGLLEACGYQPAADAEQADLILFNTCAVREHAEDRVFGNVGALKRMKEANRDLIIAVGGCMVQQAHIAEKLKKSYPYVDIIFNTNEMHRLPEHILKALSSRKTVDASVCGDYSIHESEYIHRDGGARAFIPVMYGCDNFCTYCVVPLVRGRERSRRMEDILAEFKTIVAQGYKEIMLLGQNVNSYGKGLEEEGNFAKLLKTLSEVEGDYKIRFMTSHPKDATEELFEVIASSDRISKHIHLPVQSGSSEMLRRMNRRYTAEHYLHLIDRARAIIPGVTFSSDIIVGFPGETREDFEATCDLVKKVGYRGVFTFIYSKRAGTAAAEMPDDTPHAQKAAWLNELIALQEEIAAEKDAALVGTIHRALIAEQLPNGDFEARLDDNSAVTVTGECTPNTFADIVITETKKKRLYGKVL